MASTQFMSTQYMPICETQNFGRYNIIPRHFLWRGIKLYCNVIMPLFGHNIQTKPEIEEPPLLGMGSNKTNDQSTVTIAYKTPYLIPQKTCLFM